MNKKILSYSLVLFLALLVLGNLYLNFTYKNKILPNTYINGINVGGLTEDQALEKIKILAPINKKITLATDLKEYVFNSNYFKFDYDMEETVRMPTYYVVREIF